MKNIVIILVLVSSLNSCSTESNKIKKKNTHNESFNQYKIKKLIQQLSAYQRTSLFDSSQIDSINVNSFSLLDFKYVNNQVDRGFKNNLNPCIYIEDINASFKVNYHLDNFIILNEIINSKSPLDNKGTILIRKNRDIVFVDYDKFTQNSDWPLKSVSLLDNELNPVVTVYFHRDMEKPGKISRMLIKGEVLTEKKGFQLKKNITYQELISFLSSQIPS